MPIVVKPQKSVETLEEKISRIAKEEIAYDKLTANDRLILLEK